MIHKSIIWKTSVLGNCWGMQVILLKFSVALGTTQNGRVRGVATLAGLHTRLSWWQTQQTELQNHRLFWAGRGPQESSSPALKRVTHHLGQIHNLGVISAMIQPAELISGKTLGSRFLVHSKHQHVWDRKQEELQYVCTSSLGDKNWSNTKITLVFPNLVAICYLLSSISWELVVYPEEKNLLQVSTLPWINNLFQMLP